MTNIAALALFVGLVAIGLWLASCQDQSVRRRLVIVLAAYLFAVTALGAVANRKLWPFSSWTLMPTAPPASFGENRVRLRIVGVTADGVGHRIDYRAWQPMSYEEMGTWLVLHAGSLSEKQTRGVGAFLLERAEAARAAAAESRSFGTWERWLGWFSAPSHYVHRRRWSNASDVPSTPFHSVRVYREEYDVEGRRLNREAFRLVEFFRFEGEDQ